jgi:hypothetical protein
MRDLAFQMTDQAPAQIAALRDRYEHVVYASAEFTATQCVFPGLKSSCADRVDGYAFMVAPGTRCPTLDVQSLNATWYPDTGLPIENGKGPFGAFAGESSMVTPSMYRDSPLCAYAYAGLRDNVTFATVNPATRTPDLMCQAMAAHPEMNFSAAAYLLTENPADACRQVDLGGGVWQVRCPQLKGGCDTCLR